MLNLDDPAPSPEKLIAYFSPAKSPLYLIVLSASICSVMSCTDVNGIYWVSISAFLIAVVSVSVVLSFRKTYLIEANAMDRQIGFAKAMSISAAIFTITLAAPLSQHNNMVFNILLCACAAQAVVFLIPNVEHKHTEEKTINVVQLTLITGCLLATAATSLSQYAGRCRLYDIEKEHYGDRYVAYPSDTKIFEPIMEKSEKLTEKKVDTLGEASEILRDTTHSLVKYVHAFEAEAGIFAISPRTWNRLRKESPRFLIVGAMMLILWTACLLFWITFIPIDKLWGTILRVLLGTMGTITIIWGVCIIFDSMGFSGPRRFVQNVPSLVMLVVYFAGGIGFAFKVKELNLDFNNSK